MLERKEPLLDDTPYDRTLDVEKEAFLRNKKNNDLKNAFKKTSKTGTIVGNSKTPSIFDKDSSSEEKSFNNTIEVKVISSNLDNIDNDYLSRGLLSNVEDKKTEEKNKYIQNKKQDEYIINISSEQEDISEISEEEDFSKFSKNKINEYVNNSEEMVVDVVELSKIYYYADMLDRFIGEEANIYTMLEETSLINRMSIEFEKILSKERNSSLRHIYENSNIRARYALVMDEINKNQSFMKYIDEQSKLFIKDRPYRDKALNWKDLYIENFNNKTWLEPERYLIDTNESITPWTRTGFLVWTFGLCVSLIGVYFNFQKEKMTTIEIFSPFIIMLIILTITSIMDYLAGIIGKIKYKKVERIFMNIKNAVNEVIVDKNEINPLMFDICSYYLDRKKQNKKM